MGSLGKDQSDLGTDQFVGHHSAHQKARLSAHLCDAAVAEQVQEVDEDPW